MIYVKIKTSTIYIKLKVEGKSDVCRTMIIEPFHLSVSDRKSGVCVLESICILNYLQGYMCDNFYFILSILYCVKCMSCNVQIFTRLICFWIITSW